MTELVKVESKRPYRKYTQEQMIEALEQSKGLIAPAARALGCSRDTIRSYIDEYPAVGQAKLDQEEAVKDMAENALYTPLSCAVKPGRYVSISNAGPRIAGMWRGQS